MRRRNKTEFIALSDVGYKKFLKSLKQKHNKKV